MVAGADHFFSLTGSRGGSGEHRCIGCGLRAARCGVARANTGCAPVWTIHRAVVAHRDECTGGFGRPGILAYCLPGQGIMNREYSICNQSGVDKFGCFFLLV